jgi:hypothetical protein
MSQSMNSNTSSVQLRLPIKKEDSNNHMLMFKVITILSLSSKLMLLNQARLG